eukprot:scaffold20469_cov116-Skeletonema_dohrnii-CCMP3373.AAC.1
MDGWNGSSEKDDDGEEKLEARHYVAVEQLLPDEILWAQDARTNAVLVIWCFVLRHYSTTITSSLLVCVIRSWLFAFARAVFCSLSYRDCSLPIHPHNQYTNY